STPESLASRLVRPFRLSGRGSEGEIMTEPETAVPAERDGLAVPALVTGVLGFLGITAVLGLVFGITALVRIHRTGERGRGLAIGGIAASVVWITVLPLA